MLRRFNACRLDHRNNLAVLPHAPCGWDMKSLAQIGSFSINLDGWDGFEGSIVMTIDDVTFDGLDVHADMLNRIEDRYGQLTERQKNVLARACVDSVPERLVSTPGTTAGTPREYSVVAARRDALLAMFDARMTRHAATSRHACEQVVPDRTLNVTGVAPGERLVAGDVVFWSSGSCPAPQVYEGVVVSDVPSNNTDNGYVLLVPVRVFSPNGVDEVVSGIIGCLVEIPRNSPCGAVNPDVPSERYLWVNEKARSIELRRKPVTGSSVRLVG